MKKKSAYIARDDRSLTFVLFAGVLLVFMAFFAPRLALATEGGAVAARSSNGPDLAAGDRIKITFFELLDLPGSAVEGVGNDGTRAALPSVRSFYQRLDLTGEYSVELDGSISIPRMGSFIAAHRSLQGLQSEIAGTFESTMGRPCEVTITILERQPVYVMGAARNPGAYKYVPGMMVLHALALAGGVERAVERMGRLIDILREKERHGSLAARLKRLLAQKARIEAERDGLAEAAASTRLTEFASEDEVLLLMQTENALLKQTMRSYDEEMRQNAEAIAAVRREVAVIENRREQHLHIVDLHEKRVREMSSLSGRGVVSGPMLTLAKTNLAEVNSKVDETVLLMAQVEQRMQQAERNAVRLTQERNSRIARELAANADEIIQTERELASAQRIADTLATQNPGLMADGSAVVLDFEIVRRQSGGEAHTFKADEVTLLAPGDILRVKVLATSPESSEISRRSWATDPRSPVN